MYIYMCIYIHVYIHLFICLDLNGMLCILFMVGHTYKYADTQIHRHPSKHIHMQHIHVHVDIHMHISCASLETYIFMSM